MTRLPRAPSARQLTLAFAALGLLWGAFLGFGQISGARSFLDGAENLTVDWRFRLAGPTPAPHGIVIAAIDDEAVREAGGYPVPRDMIARMVRALGDLHPRAIGVDIAFLEPGAPEADQALADALRATGAVIAAIGLFERGGVKQGRPVSTTSPRCLIRRISCGPRHCFATPASPASSIWPPIRARPGSCRWYIA